MLEDFKNDGMMDILIGIEDGNQVYLVFGTIGIAISSIGDFHNDGYDDLLIGCPQMLISLILS
jgi:hypothetical protein